MPTACHSRHTITSDVWVFICHDNSAEDRAWHIFDRLGSKIGLYVLFFCHSQLYVTNIYKSLCFFFLCNPNGFAELIMVLYHASAGIQGLLRDAPWLGVTGCATPTGQVTCWKLNLLHKDMMGTNAFPLLCSETVTVLFVLQPLTLGWPNYSRSTQVVCCKKLKLFMKVWSLNPLNHFRSQSKTIKKKEALQKLTVLP